MTDSYLFENFVNIIECNDSQIMYNPRQYTIHDNTQSVLIGT